MGRSQRSKRGRYLRTQRRELLAEEMAEKDQNRREIMDKILAEPSPAEERRASVMEEEKPKADGKTATKEEEDMEIDTQSTRKKEKRKGLGKGKGQTSYGVSEGKKWFQMFPAITKRRKNHIKKKKGAVRG